jgi:hypothetical protein
MNIVLSTIRVPRRLICVWVPTGNPRTPLACIWKDASASPGCTNPSSPTKGDGSVHLGETQLVILPGANEGVRVRYSSQRRVRTQLDC